MEFDHYLLLNFVSLFVTVLLVLVTSTTVFHRLKWRWPIKVNCWFCNNDTKIWRQELEWWLCPSCEQYNGFSKSGDYAYRIPEQYKASSKNGRRYCMVDQGRVTNENPKNNLCKSCNAQETRKVLELSEFEPVNERYYEQEIKRYKLNLEEKYPLCINCKNTVHNVLHKQTVWLAQYKMLLFRQKPICAIINKARSSEATFRIISTILDCTIAYNTDFLAIPIAGLFFQVCACCVTPAKTRRTDILLVFLWVGIIVLVPFKDLKLLKTNFTFSWLSVEYITQYHVIMLSAFLIGLLNIKPKSFTSTLNKNIAFKKIETNPSNLQHPDFGTASSTNNDQNFESKISRVISEVTSNNHPSMKTANCFTPVSRQTPVPLRYTNPLSSNTIQEARSSFEVFNSKTPTVSDSPQKNIVSNSHSLNDSWSTLSTLSLSDNLPKHTVKTPKAFERRVYSTKSPDLFKRLNGVSSRKYILSPPKLKSVTQTSWVAGGYWQEGIDAPTLSRSSSQSSGFGSAGSNFAPSREPSVHEFDQCSIMSDVTQSCYASRHNSMSSAGSFCHQGSQFSFAEPKHPPCSQITKYTPSLACTPQSFLIPPSYQRNGAMCADQCTQSQRMIVSDTKNPSDMQMLTSHTTIVTSPVWLPALLCGSLVLNIIVLCTTLLR